MKSRAGAQAFVRFYFDQVAKAWTIPDPLALDGLSDKDCITCAGYEENANTLLKAGQRYKSAPATVLSLRPMKGPPGHTQFEMVLQQNATDQLSSSGAVVKTFDQGKGTFIVDLVWSPSGWKLWGIG